MALVKTYLLAPNFTFKPGGPIALGNILANPLRPHRVLSALDPNASFKPEVEIVLDYDYKTTRGKGHGAKLSLWAQFLQTVSAKISAEKDVDALSKYTIDCLETRYFKVGPSVDEVAARLNVPRVQAALRSSIFNLLGTSRPLYIITGLKIAKGFSMSIERRMRHADSMEAAMPITENISVGGNVEVQSRSTEGVEFRSGGDIVFAYEVMKITVKGKGEGMSAEITDYYPKAAFLGREKDDEEESIEEQFVIEGLSAVTAADFAEIDKDVPLNINETDDGEICILLSGKEYNKNT